LLLIALFEEHSGTGLFAGWCATMLFKKNLTLDWIILQSSC